MNQKPLFADFIKERRSLFGKNFKKVAAVVVCVVFLGTGVMVFKPFGIGDKHKKGIYQSSKNSSVKKMIVRIKDLEKEISARQSKVFKLLTKYREKTGKELSYLNLLNLTEKEKKLLENRIKEEKRISIKSLLGTILQKANQISDLQKQVTALEEVMPKPVIVTEGRSHHQIVLDFLLKDKGLDRKRAVQVMEKSFLFMHLIPGFKVWNFYDKGEFGTFVTQGDADISPGRLQRIEIQKSISQKKSMIIERNKLTKNVESLKSSNRKLNSDISMLNKNYSILSFKYSRLDEKYKFLDKQWNSMFYRLDLKKNLVKNGVIKRGFLKTPVLNKFSMCDFLDSIDLRESKQIRVPAARLKTRRIKRVVIYPRFYKKGVDYEVSVDGQGSEAVLKILKPEKMKNERVLIAID